ncbi:hypothetical protein CDAR_527751 [Caerostris darwini]|uniref:Uncharacterized protein n=1 Tax=Caerostris darwini TaxID=1538125 RepID=A0AAV4REK9_9ARAC|nr:hypothetical protein CDAR_527751 [Caerostris darwini]
MVLTIYITKFYLKYNKVLIESKSPRSLNARGDLVASSLHCRRTTSANICQTTTPDRIALLLTPHPVQVVEYATTPAAPPLPEGGTPSPSGFTREIMGSLVR